ncbi:NACHT N-terminal Helical domain 1-containing protein [Amycolatopsis vastitatis]|uniref:ATP-binding protein n=1 Tax=Amycolatopsis vastitatis TaxID=1905142 RepID=A0A229TCF4_9PSEU|nr:NACHT domain-containing protein [Amycolatopsis vastitatis]OXM68409.1 ATP-binding protein [Amycolatopsis vastitatis]
MLKIGQAVARQVALSWFADKKAASRRGRDLAKLVRARFPMRRAERDVLDALVRIEDDVADQLAPGLAGAAHGLPDHEREAAYEAVSDALEDVDLSDDALFDVDVDPAALASLVRKQKPVELVGLSERAAGLYEVALDRACVVLVHLVRELPEFDAAVAVENLTRLRTVLGGLTELLERVPARSLDAPAGADLDERFRRRYLERVRQACDQLEVIGLTTHSYEPRTTLSVAYLSLTVTTDAGRGPGTRAKPVTDWLIEGAGGSRSAENLRVEPALGGSRLTVVRGEAGAGKSTLLRWLAVNAVQAAFTDTLADWNACVPFLVKLRDFADRPLPRGDELLTQASSPQFGPFPPEWVHRQFESGTSLLLVDGVDELVAQRRPLVRQWLANLLAAYPSLRVVVTSRPTAVTSRWLVREGFRSVVLEPMTSADVQVFLRRWHDALLDSAPDPALLPCRPDQVREHQRALLAQLQARTHLRALARSPLLCAMLCALNLDRRARLPRDRVALYTAALEMLLERRDADRNVPAEVQVSAGEKLVLLRGLAWWLNENGRSEMSREQALGRMRERLRGMPNVRESAEVLLDHLVERSGVIRQPVQGRIDFIHRTFQEFLAAQEAVGRDSIDLLVRHGKSDLWRETVLMACAQGSEEQRGRLLNGILDEAAKASPKVARQLKLLAAACKETAILAPPEVLSRVDDCIRSLVPPRSVRESRSLATVGEAVLDYLPDSVEELSPARAAACVRTASLVNGPRALEKLARYAPDPRVGVQEELVRAWKYFDPESYARNVLADAPLISPAKPMYKKVEVEFAAAVPFLHLLRHLRSCRVNLWKHGPVADEIRALSEARQLKELTLLGDIAPETLPGLAKLTRLEELFVNFTTGWPSSLDFLAELTQLWRIHLVNAGNVRDFRFLRAMPDLRMIFLLHNPVQDWMDEVACPEKVGSIYAKGVDSTENLRKVLARFPRLKNLTLGRATATDLSPLRDSGVENLGLVDCGELDVSPLDHNEISILSSQGVVPVVNVNRFRPK